MVLAVFSWFNNPDKIILLVQVSFWGLESGWLQCDPGPLISSSGIYIFSLCSVSIPGPGCQGQQDAGEALLWLFFIRFKLFSCFCLLRAGLRLLQGQWMEGGAEIPQTGRMGYCSIEYPALSAPAWPHNSSDLPAALLAKNIPYLHVNFWISFIAKHICLWMTLQGSVLACGCVRWVWHLPSESLFIIFVANI